MIPPPVDPLQEDSQTRKIMEYEKHMLANLVRIGSLSHHLLYCQRQVRLWRTGPKGQPEVVGLSHREVVG